MLCGDAFRVKLNPVDGEGGVPDTHDSDTARPIVTSRVDDQLGRQILDDQAVVASGGEGGGKAREQSALVVTDRRGLAMHQMAAHHPCAELLADCLMAKTHSEQWPPCGGASGNEVKADPGVIRRSGPGRNQKRIRAGGHGLADADRIIAHDLNRDAQFHQIMNQVKVKLS